MIKYVEKSIVFEEVPDRVSLAFSISKCQNKCKGCHSPFLRCDVGNELTKELFLNEFNKTLKYCNCVLFLGEGDNLDELIELNRFIKEKFKNIETAIYSGRDKVELKLFDEFDFVKVGSYQEDKGGLKSPTTNQRMFYHSKDITHLFWE